MVSGNRCVVCGSELRPKFVTPKTRAERIRIMKRKTFERAFKRLARYTRPGRLLDVGCPFGASLEVAREQGWDVYGLEMNPHAGEMFAIARTIRG